MIRSILAATLALTAVPAISQETQASAAAKLKAEFAASDRNKDGALSRAEVGARLGGMKSTGRQLTAEQKTKLADLWFGRADANGDGKVTEAESQALMSQVFRRYDANNDGKVGGGERAAAKKGVTKGR